MDTDRYTEIERGRMGRERGVTYDEREEREDKPTLSTDAEDGGLFSIPSNLTYFDLDKPLLCDFQRPPILTDLSRDSFYSLSLAVIIIFILFTKGMVEVVQRGSCTNTPYLFLGIFPALYGNSKFSHPLYTIAGALSLGGMITVQVVRNNDCGRVHLFFVFFLFSPFSLFPSSLLSLFVVSFHIYQPPSLSLPAPVPL